VADVFSKEKRSEIMSRIRATNSRPEILVRKFLFSQGLRFRKNVSHFPGKPDIVLSKYKTVVFVNGCFWHAHSCKTWTHRKIFWQKKIASNIERDKKNIKAIRKLGWKVIVVWKCDIMSKSKSDKRLRKLVHQIILTRKT
jgi:DNA mismatch endonuclease, patch repair protein